MRWLSRDDILVRSAPGFYARLQAYLGHRNIQHTVRYTKFAT